MARKIKVAASILCADFTKLGDEIRKAEDAGADLIHLDVMDGHFVPNISIGQVILEAIRPVTKLPIEAHLMIENPWLYFNDFIERGANIISIQAECYGERRPQCRGVGQFPKEIEKIDEELASRDIVKIKRKNARAFMVLNPGTPLCLGSLTNILDGVLVMSVNPGFAKQAFMPEVVPKIQTLRGTFRGDIAVDGGINERTAPDVIKAGANILSAASYIFKAPSMKEAIKNLKALADD